MATLYTAGYQGRTIEEFLALLGAHGVTRVIDVRQRPFSRKPDFSRARLGAHLDAAGVAYTHLVALGTPKPLRDAVRRTRDYAAFFEAVREVLAGQEEALGEALALIEREPCLLLCFEADVATCHRLSVAEALVARAPEIQVMHL